MKRLIWIIPIGTLAYMLGACAVDMIGEMRESAADAR